MVRRRRAPHLRKPSVPALVLPLLIMVLAAPGLLASAAAGQAGTVATTSHFASPGDTDGALSGDSKGGRLMEAGRLGAEPAQSEVTSPAKPGIGQIPGLRPALPDLLGETGMLVLLIVMLGAATPLFWRIHRRDDASPRRIGRRV